MADVPVAAGVFYDSLRQIRSSTTRVARVAWGQIAPAFLDDSWRQARAVVAASIVAAQVEAASAGVTYGAFALAEQGAWVAPEAFVDPGAFGGGWSSTGARLDETLEVPAIRAKQAIAGGAGTVEALRAGWESLSGIVALQVNDAGRVAAGADTASRKGVGYVRMLNPPSCDRCTVLAGRFFRWNAGFRRHPRCDCVHVPSAAGSTEAALREGLVDDPYEYFRGLSEEEQARRFGKYEAEAIRDGADIYQVINSKRGRQGAFTTEGTSRRGNAASVLRPGQRRMTPETIYRLNPNREDALRALRDQGYILPGGQAPGGSLRGRVEGFGQMGRGGARKAASDAIREARRTGVRDPRNRYTMTAAERRLYDAEQRYEMVLQGRNPYSSPAFGNTPDPTGANRATAAGSRAPLTPMIAAQVEADYRRWLATGGQIF